MQQALVETVLEHKNIKKNHVFRNILFTYTYIMKTWTVQTLIITLKR